ncbi:peptidase dimerization domain-containing protein, partial [Vibrio cholerae]|nr:peptidase dimerization domain-containing protein [Vibrio cholerae]
AIEMLLADPSIPHGDISIAFTPDEEIGRGANHFDVAKFAAQWAYTIDGGPIGELEYENFNAAMATVTCHGVNVHPGTAKDKMVNAMHIAAQFILMMPESETPQHTEGYQGFYHLSNATMGVAKSELKYILRDFEANGLQARQDLMQAKVAELNQQLKKGRVEVSFEQSYS